MLADLYGRAESTYVRPVPVQNILMWEAQITNELFDVSNPPPDLLFKQNDGFCGRQN